MVDPSLLHAFVAVARSGAVGRAAAQLGRTQPAVSSRVASLERTWGTRLFRRRPRGMELTDEGARLLPQAQAVLAALAALDREAGVAAAADRAIRVGAGDALGRDRLPRALRRLLRERPGLEVHVREGPGPRLLADLRRGEVDLVLVLLPGGGLAPEGIESVELTRSEVDLLAPAGALAAGRRAVDLGAIVERPFVALQAGSAFRAHVERAFVSAGRSFRPTVEVGNLSLVRRFVAAGLGLAPVPALAFAREARLRGIDRRRLGGIPPLSYVAAWRAETPPSPLARRLVELLR